MLLLLSLLICAYVCIWLYVDAAVCSNITILYGLVYMSGGEISKHVMRMSRPRLGNIVLDCRPDT